MPCFPISEFGQFHKKLNVQSYFSMSLYIRSQAMVDLPVCATNLPCLRCGPLLNNVYRKTDSTLRFCVGRNENVSTVRSGYLNKRYIASVASCKPLPTLIISPLTITEYFIIDHTLGTQAHEEPNPDIYVIGNCGRQWSLSVTDFKTACSYLLEALSENLRH